jgi:hypothetical protein
MTFDITILVIVLAVIVGLLLGYYSPDICRKLKKTMTSQMFLFWEMKADDSTNPPKQAAPAGERQPLLCLCPSATLPRGGLHRGGGKLIYK